MSSTNQRYIVVTIVQSSGSDKSGAATIGENGGTNIARYANVNKSCAH